MSKTQNKQGGAEDVDMDSDTDQQQDNKFDYTQRPELEIQR